MLRVRLARAGIAIVGVLTLGALFATGSRGALPSVSSGQAPGPPVLYAPSPTAPQLQASGPFAAAPLLVSGTDAYADGEYLYQDYLFDDRGADTAPGLGSRLDSQNFSPTAGDVQYPTGPEYLGNAADLVEFRVTTTATAVVYRVTLNTVVADDAAVVGIGIDTDRSGGAQVAWPNGAGVSSPGLDAFITAWGTGGELTSLPGGPDTALPAGSVSMDLTRKQMTISVPRASLDPGLGPGAATWRYVTGAGLWDSAAGAWNAPSTGTTPGADEPASGSLLPAPAVLNLGFRFDEPRLKQPGPTSPIPYTTGPGTGNWNEDKQAYVLSSAGGATTSAGLAGGANFHADVDFAKLASSADEPIHAPGATQVRIFPSSLDDEQGVREVFPEYRGQLQPYLLRVPAGLDPSQPTPLTFALHSLGGNHNQYGVFSPNQLVQFGDQRDNLVATPLAHGADGWYTDEGETDVFEVWADINRSFNLDPGRTYASGYSMGGYGSYKLGVEYPDLWAKVFTTVGPPGEGVWLPPADPSAGPETLTADLLGNVRWVPYLNWVGSSDELVPIIGPIVQQQRFDSLGLRSKLLIFSPADHFLLAAIDEWATARDFLGDASVKTDPSRVDYRFFPAADRAALGLVHDHAYWVSKLLARDTSAGAEAIAGISVRSLAQGEGDPTTQSTPGSGVDAGPPLSYVQSGTEWTGIPSVPAENALEATLENLSKGEIDGSRAQLDGARQLRVELETDGASELRLRLPLPAGSTAVRVEPGGEQPAPEVALSATGATFALSGAGTRTYLIRPPSATGGGTGTGTTPGTGSTPGTAPGTSSGPAARCKGRAATIVGTPGSDRLRGTSGDDVIAGRGGPDRIRGRGGDDVICGNKGRDRLSGGAGEDSCYGGSGRDAAAPSCELARSPSRARRR